MIRRLAPAKVNLFLHVGPPEPDGYHPLVSLVAFADIGDEIEVAPSDRLRLTLGGPFAGELGDGEDNLILRALRELGRITGREPRVHVHLDKRLPIAAGLGGGSSDAAAALRAADEMLGLDLGEAALAEVARSIGADGPMCLRGRTALAQGHGDRLTDWPGLSPLPAVLINPGVASPTGEVYRAYDAAPARADLPPPLKDRSVDGVVAWLAGCRNDLQRVAVGREAVIGAALDAAGRTDAALVRMSGSGATVFALYRTRDEAARAASRLTVDHPDWWIRPCVLGSGA